MASKTDFRESGSNSSSADSSFPGHFIMIINNDPRDNNRTFNCGVDTICCVEG